MFIGHGGTLFTCTTQLCGRSIPSVEEEAYNLFTNTQYLDCKQVQAQADGTFKLIDSPIPPFTCSGYKGKEMLWTKGCFFGI